VAGRRAPEKQATFMSESVSQSEGAERAWRRRVLLIGVVALVLQLSFAFGFARFFRELQDKQIGDQGYDIAVNLVDGKGYLHNWFGLDYLAWRPPVFPLLMAGLISVFGKGWGAIKFVLALCGAGTAVVTAYLGRRMFDARVGLIAGAVTALNPSLIFSSGWPEPSCLIALLLVTGCLAMFRAKDGGLKESAAAGGMMGITVLAKTFYLTWPIFATAWLLLQKDTLKRRLQKAAVIWAVTLAMASPWMVRNYMVFHTPRIATTDTSLVFWAANAKSWLDGSVMEQKLPPREFKERFHEFEGLSEIERDKWFLRDALKTVGENKEAYFKRVFERIWLIWKPFPYVPKWGALPAAKFAFMLLTFGPILGFFLASVWVLRREWRKLALSYMLIVGVTGSLALVHGVSRYRVPLEPLLIVQGAYVMALVWDRYRKKAPAAPAVTG
jgi:4-amino-4-deoxy-L-arabinose transferase-like glycosyltransferase